MRTIAAIAALLACFPPLAAQAVTASMSALTPLTAQVSDGTQTVSATLPAGPLASYSGTGASLPGAANGYAVMNWHVYGGDTQAAASLELALGNPTGLPFFLGNVGPEELLVEFTSAVPVTGTLQLYRSTDLTPGAPWPSIQIDFDNNGVFEVPSLSALSPTSRTASFGPQPLLVRIRIAAAVVGNMESYTTVFLVLVPDNNLTITTAVASCNPTSPPPPPFVQPLFGNQGLRLGLEQQPFAPSLMVIGFAAQPLLLSVHATMPCLLLPRPDVVLFEPTGRLDLPLPPSVRPVTFFAQGVTLSSVIGLVVTDGFLVTAF